MDEQILLDNYATDTGWFGDQDLEIADNEIPLRRLRRRFGISQTCLADLLGVNQATVSRWERGTEELNLRRKRELFDLFSNRRGHFDPLIKRLVDRLPFVTVFNGRRELLHISEHLARRNGVAANELLGHTCEEVIDMSWERQLFGGEPNENILMADCVHCVVGTGQFADRMHRMSIRKKRYHVHFDGFAAMTFNVVSPLRGEQQPKLLSMVTWNELDDL